MKISLQWLKEIVPVEASAEEIAERLTFSGTEVESIAVPQGSYDRVVIGRVQEVRPHPDADKLVLCVVDAGDASVDVVCGATNFKEGDNVVLAMSGATLPSGFAIKSRKVRGIKSEGMLCAEDELGISDDHSGIMIMPPGISPGSPFSEIAGEPDTVLTLEVTWNRPDCLSIIGIAREVSALFDTPLRMPGVDFNELPDKITDSVSVQILEPEKCPRYTARIVKDVDIGPSPVWMRKRLHCCGIRPINNVVDITNYVLLEWGQPLHAFDYDCLKDKTIIVRNAENECIRTLDGSDRKLGNDMLVIADSARPVALAGVMGGENTEINQNTSTILLESACFNPADIRNAAVEARLSSESSYRFERGVDIGNVDTSARRAVNLLVRYAGAQPLAGCVDEYPGKKAPERVECRLDRLRKILGFEISEDSVAAIFESLGLSVEKRDAGIFTVQVPSYRRDIKIEADLIEEIARIHGVDNIPVGDPRSRIVPGADDSGWQAAQKCGSALAGLGFYEIVNYSTTSCRLLDIASATDGSRRLVLPNPVSSDHAVLRDCLSAQMIETLGKNHSRQVEDAAFYEIGVVFEHGANGNSEEQHVCLGLMGRPETSGLEKCSDGENEDTFLRLKGAVEELCRLLHVKDLDFRQENIRCMDKAASVSVLINGEKAGCMGLVKEQIRSQWRIATPVGLAELKLKPLLCNVFRIARIKAAPQYPAIKRDMALVVDKSVLNGTIEKIIWENAPGELTGVHLFDIFTDTSRIGGNRKSLAYNLSYRSNEKTLTDEEANRLHEAIKDVLKQKLNADIREG